jgi:hypothetical protein
VGAGAADVAGAEEVVAGAGLAVVGAGVGVGVEHPVMIKALIKTRASRTTRYFFISSPFILNSGYIENFSEKLANYIKLGSQVLTIGKAIRKAIFKISEIQKGIIPRYNVPKGSLIIPARPNRLMP